MSKKLKLAAIGASLFSTFSFANIYIGNVKFQDNYVIPDPTGKPFLIEYTLFGSQPGHPQGFVEFNLSLNGTPTSLSLGKDPVQINCGTNGCVPVNRSRFYRVYGSSMDHFTRDYLSNLCTPTKFQVIGRYNGTSSLSHNEITLGGNGKPDWFLSSGFMTPSNIPIGYPESIRIKYTVENSNCKEYPILPEVGFFLANTNQQPIHYFGSIPALGGSGSQHEVNISLQHLNLPVGKYHIILLADVHRSVDEKDETNNFGTFALHVYDPAQQGSSVHNSAIDKLNTLDNKPVSTAFSNQFDAARFHSSKSSIDALNEVTEDSIK
ncbi:hypothetical protein L1286_20550 [Pseudoalteromonas sp. SMS1]|uniref:hypothetical protein n=1 Tax=Pseudoalteromonas sp. SMS1 TaxID=2908894 RepID=UPI001F3E37A1|nr:hypothetical protein [Pseudoalteromonas sp. SMS1]MCF2859878.1 hypothetical protein [Pseudoalteromonas sp. SMS1]